MADYTNKFKELKRHERQIIDIDDELSERLHEEGATDEIKLAYEQLSRQDQLRDARQRLVEQSLTSEVDADAKVSMGVIDGIKSAIDSMVSKTAGFFTFLVGIAGAFYGKIKSVFHNWRYPKHQVGGAQRRWWERGILAREHGKFIAPDTPLAKVRPPILSPRGSNQPPPSPGSPPPASPTSPPPASPAGPTNSRGPAGPTDPTDGTGHADSMGPERPGGSGGGFNREHALG